MELSHRAVGSHPRRALDVPITSLSRQPSSRERRVCLVPTPFSSQQSSRDLKAHLASAGFAVTCFSCEKDVSPPLSGSRHLQYSYRVFERLRYEAFDVVAFEDRGGAAYYSMLAKCQGLAFAETELWVVASGSSRRDRETFGKLLQCSDELELDELERRSATMADRFWGQSDSVAKWCEENSWPCPTLLTVETLGGLSFPKTPPASDQWSTVPSIAPSSLPLVSVCLVHHNRPYLLSQAIRSLERQDYPNLEIILIDDGSTHPAATRVLDLWESRFANRGWKILRTPNQYLGAARNTAARAAEGEYLLFMDDDNIAKPHEISTFVAVANRTGADILTCLFDQFMGSKVPIDEVTRFRRYLIPGIKTPLGMLRNCYGDANAMIRRDRFWELGGFTEDFGVTHEDWEFLAKASLSGLRVEVIPEALFWYRVQPGSMIRTTHRARNLKRSLRPFLAAAPAFFRSLLEYAVGQSFAVERLSSEIAHLRGKVKLLEKHAKQLEFQLARRDMHLRQARYQWADRLNDGLKRLPMANRFARRFFRKGSDGHTNPSQGHAGGAAANEDAPGALPR